MARSNAVDVPVRWSVPENVAWKTTTPGSGSVAHVAGGRIDLTRALAREGRLALAAFCIDAASLKGRRRTPLETPAKDAPNTPSMVVVDDLSYGVSDAGIASAIEATTGKVAWSERLGGNFSASILHAAGRLYFQNEEGMGFVLKPGRAFEVLARNDMAERTPASDAVDDDGALDLRTRTSLNPKGRRP